ncbi:MAG: iron-sulfur cluster assembly scaffold protein, partial [Proteobacteria bacterium]|nr:iron-sulfur cluster assembly scaffold protein [Pseudomonadota bacterium]MBU1581476.1 iron-sulfur cluster assembly scaffold protein [Pseudomonadota bacterium]
MNTKNNKPFDFWNDHSLEFLEMAMKRDYQERIASCDGYGIKIRECGDTIEFFLMVKEKVIQSISYDIKGCLFSHACANTVIKLAHLQSIEDARKISSQDIITCLKTLPKNEEHCADHAHAAFYFALDDY